jgi:ferredoxin
MYAPDLFGQDEGTGLVTVLLPEPGIEHRELAERAVLACPSLAIWLEDEMGRRLS